MRLRSKDAVPDHWRRAWRLGIAVFTLSAVGFSLIGTGNDAAVMLCKWATLTLPVVTMPLLGKTSQVGFERILGTVVGGLLGFACDGLATHWWTLQDTETDDIAIALAAATFAFVSVLAGKRWGLDLSAKLFVIAFVLVAFSAQQGQDPRQVAATRIGGIAGGVLTMMLMSVLILPKSASVESLRTLRKSLKTLQEVNAAAWGDYLAQPQRQQQQQLERGDAAEGDVAAGGSSWGGKAGADGDGLREPLLRVAERGGGSGGGSADLEAGHGQQALAGPCPAGNHWTMGRFWSKTVVVDGELAADEEEARLLESEKAVTALYQLFSQLSEQLTLAKNEWWLGNPEGRPLVLPGLWPRRQASHLPWDELQAMAGGVRRVARLLSTLLATLDSGFDAQLREVLGPAAYSAGLLPALAAGAGAAIADLQAAFPCERAAPRAGLDAFTASVLALAEVGGDQRRRVEATMRKYRARTAARASWSRLIDAVLTPTTSDAAQQAQQTQQPNGGSAAAPGAPGSGAAAAATVEPEPSALALQEASLTGWLRRAGSGLLGSRASMAASDASSAADADGTAAAAAGKEGDAAGTGQAASGEGGAGNALARTSLTASASHRLGLSAALDTLVEGEPAGGPPAASLVSPERSLQRVSAAASPASPLLGRLPRGFMPSSPLLASRLDAVRGDVPEGIPLLLFPDTTEGRLAQVSWFSFQFVCEELAEQLEALHAATDAVLRKLPA